MTSTPKTVDHLLAAVFEQSFRQASRDSAFAFGDASAKLLFEAGTPSPHGRGGQTVYDREYRDAHELKPDRFALDVDLISATGIIGQIAKHLETGPLVAKPNKLNMYHKGGFFKVHKDTPLDDKHLGSIVMCLPSFFQGGELVVKHEDHTVVFDFAKDVGAGEETVSWAFLLSDVEHEVLPVTTGTRVAIAYDVYHADVSPVVDVDPRNNGVASALSALLLDRDNNGFLPEGGLVGIGLLHGYPSDGDDKRYAEKLLDRLKGADKCLVQAIEATNLDWEFNAMFSQEMYSDKHDGFYNQICRTPNFFLVKNMEMGENGGSVREAGGVEADDVHWLVPPQHYDVANPYIAYGNDHSIEHIYAAVAVMIELAPVDGSEPRPSRLAKNQPEGSKLFAPKWEWGY